VKSLDASLVAPNLALGSVPPKGETLADSGVRVLVLAAKEAQPPASDFPGVAVIRVPFLDRFFEPLDSKTLANVVRVAREVAKRAESGDGVLVTCLMGLNRSGLITGLALRMLGYSGKEAVSMLQQKRPGALSNLRFRRIVETFEP